MGPITPTTNIQPTRSSQVVVNEFRSDGSILVALFKVFHMDIKA